MNLLLLAVPLGGLAGLRFYESVLVRQTESALVAQGAVLAAAFRQRLVAQGAAPAGNPVHPSFAAGLDAPWQPRPPVLDLATSGVGPVAPAARLAGRADDVAARAGAELREVLLDTRTVTLTGLRIVDASGVVVASTGGDVGLSLTARDEVRRALRGEPVSVLRRRELDGPTPPLSSISRGTRLRATVLVPVILDDRVVGAVMLERTPARILKVLFGKRREVAIAAIAILLVAGALAWLTSRAISAPVQGLIRQARRASDGERGAMVPLERPVTREVDDLSQRLAEMSRVLEQRAEYIRTFAQHVSHEFKTPLAAISGTVELLTEHAQGMTEAERDRFLANLRDDTARLDTLVRRLLDLARADTAAPGSGASASVNAALGELNDLEDASFAVGVTPLGGGSDRVAIPADALASTLASVVANARQHGASGVRVSAARSDSGQISIDVEDNGPGISAANRERIFDPFFTTARDSGGTGLGLTVARTLLRAHGGDLLLAPRGSGRHDPAPAPAGTRTSRLGYGQGTGQAEHREADSEHRPPIRSCSRPTRPSGAPACATSSTTATWGWWPPLAVTMSRT